VSDLLASHRQELAKVAVRRRFARHEVVFHEGDPGDSVHVVTRGAFIARSSTTMGHIITVNIMRTGEVFGELALLSPDARRTATVSAMQQGETLMVRRHDFDAIRDKDPSIDRFLIDVLAQRNRKLTADLVDLLFTPVEQRVRSRLLIVGDLLADEDGWIPLNQEEIASLAGATRATVNRVLRRAEVAGYVELRRGRVRIIDRQGLASRSRR
jgi:CRP/FNR family transcriptional regulator, cyclic AMP receptor protein